MRTMFRYTAVLLLFPFAPALATPAENPRLPGIAWLDIGAADASADVAAELLALLDDGRRTVLTGDPAALAAVRPSFVHAWPATNTIVLDPAAGLGVFGFDAADAESRITTLAGWSWGDDIPESSRGTRSLITASLRRQISMNITANSPAQVCRNFSVGMLSALFGGKPIGVEERRAFRREVRRWCQYGSLSRHFAERPQFTIAPFRSSSLPRLSLSAEWALLRSEDPTNTFRTSYLFWTRTMGEGGGSGFTLRNGVQAWLDPATREVQNIMDVAIHSGWGAVDAPDVVTAWPVNSTFPYTADIHLFRCDAPEVFRPNNCPVWPELRKLYPEDTFDGKITASVASQFQYGGEAKIGATTHASGIPTVSLTFGLQALRGSTHTAQADIPLVHTRSNAGAIFFRSTWWTPDIQGIYQWLAARPQVTDLGTATPLASTLNPRHEIIWELPLRGNAGRALPYHVAYEVGLNTCNEAFSCVGSGPLSHASAKARVGWIDGITLFFPVD